MKVCYFGTYRAEYSRNQILIEGLRQNGVEVIECHQTLWRGIEDRVAVTKGGWLRPAFWWRILSTYFKLLRQYHKIKDYDILIIGYPGQLDVFLARILTRLKRKPLVWDVFMSLYLIAKERKLDKKNSFSVNLLKKIESRALRIPDLLIQDTSEYIKWFQNVYGISSDRFRLVPTGADDRVFKPVSSEPLNDGCFHVLYYGTFIPNHGVKIILQAAELLKDKHNILIELIGDGPEKKEAEEFVHSKNLSNIRFLGWMDQGSLVNHISQANICLGAFGNTPQSLMTVQNKIYECMAMGKVVLTGASPAITAEFINQDSICFSERNPKDLAQAILDLKNNPRLCRSIGENALNKFRREYSISCLGAKLAAYLHELSL
jgi:glycosyltransferase involved in cell wall biosynthesis